MPMTSLKKTVAALTDLTRRAIVARLANGARV